MAECLTSAQTTTHTATSRPSDDPECVSIATMITLGAKADFNKPIAICENCGFPTEKDLVLLDVMRRVRVMCKCKEEERKREDERAQAAELRRRLNKFRVYSLMDKQFESATFSNWKHRADNRDLYDLATSYAENWEDVFANNRGLLLYGKAGSGKTFASFAIANELYSRGKSVLAISVSRILAIIKDNYNKHGDIGEVTVLNTLSDASLLILDDLGVEYKTPWAHEKLYSIIDARYRAQKPVIITTNLGIDELRVNLSTVDIKTMQYDQSNRIYDRIVEMCAIQPVTGGSWRIQKGERNRNDLYKALGLGGEKQ